MTDLNERLRGIDRLSAPDLWETARVRAEARVGISSERRFTKRIATTAVSLLISLAAVTLLVIAFQPPTPGPISPGEAIFPTTQNGPSGMLALYEGSLVERDGCIFMDGGDQVSLPVWPRGYSVDRGPSGALQIHADDGTTVAVVGEPISMGGGYVAEFLPRDRVEPRDAQIDRIEEQLGPIPQRCLGPDVYGVWAVGVIENSEPGGSPSAGALLVIRVWTSQDPFDLHISATFRGEEVELVAIETPGSELEYPATTSVDLPVGTPIVVESNESHSVGIFELAPARGELVENGSCIIPGSLRALPGPAETAFFIYVEGNSFSAGQAFRAETVGDSLEHDSAIDPTSVVDANLIGLAICAAPASG